MANSSEIGQRCLVTGSSGFVGRRLVDRLLQGGHNVHGLDAAPATIEHERYTHFTGDIRDADLARTACEGVDTVFHTAAIINLLRMARPAARELVTSVNVDGTANVLKAALDAGAGAFVHTSSHNVGIAGTVEMGDEETPYADSARDLYTTTKIAAERLVLAADGDGIRTAAIRPGGVWGPDDGSIMLTKFLDEVAKGRYVVLIGDGKARTDSTHVENVVEGLILAAIGLRNRPDVVGGQAYLITDDEPMNTYDWYRPIVEGLGYPHPKRHIPAAPLRWAAWLGELFHRLGAPEPLLQVAAIDKITLTCTFRIDKAKRDLGYKPLVDLKRGAPDIIEYARGYLERSQTST